jgi:hypothetical protein
MPRVRPNAAERWARRAAQATPDYVAGVQNPRQSWAQAAAAAEASWQAGVQQAISDKRWTRGIQTAGDQKWQSKTVAKGQSRFAEGVGQAQPDYQAGVAPYLQTIESLNLPPRGPKGDPRNIERVRIIAMTLRNKKLALAGKAVMALLIGWATTATLVGCAATVEMRHSPPTIQTTISPEK